MTRLVPIAFALYFLAVAWAAPLAWAAHPAKLVLAQCVLAEDDFVDEQDAAGVLWVLRKRAEKRGVPLEQQTRDYCAIFSKTSARYYGKRPAIIRESTLAQPPTGYEKRWKPLLAFVDRFLAGEIEDPCPKCRHWRGREDRKPDNWECPFKRLNEFCFVQK